ncbi:MAG: response regulator, partial [Candidatus Geothermincolia bacterium]
MGDTPHKRILVVDDDPGQAKLISLLLKREFNAIVETAFSCAQARDELVTGNFDLVTLDYQLPDGDGLELLEEIQKKTDPPPVVVITGHGDEQTAVAAFKKGAYGYVIKDRRMSTMIVEEARSAMARARLLGAEVALVESQSRYQEM